MPRRLEFAFLGCHSSYLASVTWVNQSNCPCESPTIKCHGLPSDFERKYREFSRNRYISNVRGHDCFTFLGHWTKETTKGFTDTSAHILAEIDALEVVKTVNKENNHPHRNGELLLSLGPAPGSYFVDAYRLRVYCWENLPKDLNFILQRHVNRNKYGTIHDVAINATAGWVMQLHKGKSYEWGGELPEELERALKRGQERKATIKNLYLNHQNKDDYILVFTDGHVYVSLHKDFEIPMRKLIESTFPSTFSSGPFSWIFKPVKVTWNFTPSCACGKDQQRLENAKFYNQRGQFHLRKGNLEKALICMRAAHDFGSTNTRYRDDYYMTLVAVRSRDPTPEENITRFDSNNAFHNEFAFWKDRIGRIELLEERMRIVLNDAQQRELPNEWVYDENDNGTVFHVELPSDEIQMPIFELEHPEHLGARSSSNLTDPSKQVIMVWR
ncbi:hypothetical protein K505DRAFT_358281 [Melanomma pulvis-pyrius CBS 109.77]|uniref:Uncharacterized protein n=1 Tax=Melanomma pulvis-pyrius CBS 109.77 TaxID=1314802 RepID=A0A6A6XN69_9PLEO|nr:hypothetical protein K505DRAFT_358281 [Melanomma pulvis-pyrius CBS 109.77]